MTLALTPIHEAWSSTPPKNSAPKPNQYMTSTVQKSLLSAYNLPTVDGIPKGSNLPEDLRTKVGTTNQVQSDPKIGTTDSDITLVISDASTLQDLKPYKASYLETIVGDALVAFLEKKNNVVEAFTTCSSDDNTVWMGIVALLVLLDILLRRN